MKSPRETLLGVPPLTPTLANIRLSLGTWEIRVGTICNSSYEKQKSLSLIVQPSLLMPVSRALNGYDLVYPGGILGDMGPGAPEAGSLPR